MNSPQFRAFTLIELSIVLVIIGLIVSGILVGQSLIEAAYARKIVSEERKYEQAFLAFRIKYNYLPGDIKNPDRFWQPGTWNRNAGPNEDGMISWAWEGPEAWRQLALAKLIEGNFLQDCRADPETSGSTAAARPCAGVGGKTAPPSAYRDGVWTILNLRKMVYSGGMHYGNAMEGNGLVFGSNPYRKQIGIKSIMSAIMAYGIDSKIDDGNPLSGRIMAIASSYVNFCYKNSTTNRYLLVPGVDPLLGDPAKDYSKKRSCALVFKTSY
jgi:prepilin-type N-terminal cleavage/methylation domain-containing protein